MRLLEEKILDCGEVKNQDVLKVDSFLNHQIDVQFMNKLGEEFYRLFKDTHPTKIMTLEASGISIAVLTALHFKLPVIFAKKTESLNLDNETYTSEVYSFTRQKSYQIKVSRRYLSSSDRVRIVDDFLARGSAVHGMMKLCHEAGAEICGVGILIEKAFQEGGRDLREKGVNLHSLAIVESMSCEEGIVFQEEK